MTVSKSDIAQRAPRRRSAVRTAKRVLGKLTDGEAPSSSALRRIAIRPLRSVLHTHESKFRLLGDGLVDVGGIVDDDRRRATERIRELRARVKDLERRLSDLEPLHGRVDELARRLDSTDGAVLRLDAEQQATPYVAPGTQVRATTDGGTEVLALGADNGSDYADFEDTYRGSEEFVRDRLASYVGLVGDGPVLDLGCGRGEFLELMAAAGVPARGVDLDESMAARARAKGLDVSTGDGLALLRDIPRGTLGAVTSFQVIEHIPVPLVRELFVGAAAALRPGGVLVAETVNPHSPAALKTFWLDLTHVRPLFPESLLFLAREVGFEEAWIHLPQGTGDLDRDLRLCGEFALVARKA
ncbi:class I SAM-dependent methyltransferase [Pimelobacter simplex]|uniref:class I SAM-dependent methyltransferase n=1 Tax=Nocardioides simplex TaxID=2045 RepID=UPI001931A5BA|nr:methyltransferase domain-containing protein [Pimelobacter simplex]